jgi:hypothetical protein
MHSSLHIVSLCLRKGLGGASSRGSIAMPSHSITSHRQMVLHLTALMGAGRHVETGGGSALGHTSTRHYHCSRASGKTACGRGKLTSKLVAIECRLGTTLLAPAPSASVAPPVTTCESSLPRIDLIKAERINLSNNLEHVLMHEILL